MYEHLLILLKDVFTDTGILLLLTGNVCTCKGHCDLDLSQDNFLTEKYKLLESNKDE